MRNLRQRIFRATQEGEIKKVRSLQKLMLRSYSNRLLQQGVATIHGMETPINQLQSRENFLIKLVIDKNIKADIALALDEFGIIRSYLFPDLDNLATEIQEGTNLDRILEHFA